MKRLLPFAWGLSISLGALWIRLSPRHPDWLQSLIDCEPFHWFAHSFLYGILTFLARRLLGGPRWLAVGTTLVLGGIQELAQVVGVRSFGSPELFDLGVDLCAALLVVLISG